MADYSHLAKLHVTEQSEAEYTFDQIWGDPSIVFRPMVDSNPDFFNERVRLAVARAEAEEKKTKAQRKAKIISSERLDEDRQQDIILLAKCCAVRWGNAPRDVNGDQAEFSADEVLSFLQAMPSYMIDPLRGWASNPYNFVDRDAAKPLWADALGNSSPTD